MIVRNSKEPFQILSIDGGGVKGLFVAATLAAMEDDLGINIIDHFDLITGTSTGGIIALGLGRGLKPKEIVKFYIDKCPTIFRDSFKRLSLKHWLLAKFPQAPLRDALREIFGNHRLCDSQKRLVIPAYSLDQDDIYLFKTPHHERLRRDFKLPMWKVALATSAAPTYFPSCREIDCIRHIDGGVWANNPTLVGIIEAVSMLNVPLERISVLSIGTCDELVRRQKFLNWAGRLLWATSAIEIIMRGQSVGVTKQAKHLLGAGKVERVDPKVPTGLLRLDRLTVDELLARASHESRTFSPMFANKFQSHMAAPYEPRYRISKELLCT
jgi:patatin-like phospholipase/acyl hydrolase